MSEGLMPKAACIRQITSVLVTSNSCKIDMSYLPDMCTQSPRVHLEGKSRQLC